MDTELLIGRQMRSVEACYEQCLGTDVPLLREVLEHIGHKRGKMLRPMLTVLAAGCEGGGEVSDDSVIKLATAVELIHNASLLHDDVIDMSSERRGQPSVNAVFGTKAAILSGDYLLSKAMALVSGAGIAIVLSAVRAMSEGELIQLSASACGGNPIDIKTYLDITGRKTASLMAAACALGSEKLYDFGYHYGMAFQIRDDIADGETFPAGTDSLALLHTYCEKAAAALQVLPDTPYRQALSEFVASLETGTNY